ncbi:hypothetical protein [Achromobacter veterisilvae]|uniref:hypothetical protein n=1 Tax=Achromobacter veterisilvae TaxID=2069367 RepID=UPI00100FA7C0|nr:hypothetical protein [Achromobacter veterisilvae]
MLILTSSGKPVVPNRLASCQAVQVQWRISDGIFDGMSKDKKSHIKYSYGFQVDDSFRPRAPEFESRWHFCANGFFHGWARFGV